MLTLFIALSFLNASKTITSGVVVQFGVDIIPVCHSTSCPFTSGTTNGTDEFIRKTDPSSITTTPLFTAMGAHFSLI